MILTALKEKRYTTNANYHVRAITGDTNNEGKAERFIEGYAALYNHESKLLAEWRDNGMVEFYETLLSGCFDEVLSSPNLNVIHTIDHDRGKMVARTKSGTLVLTTDENGLKYRFSVPNTTLGNDLFEMVQRGDLFESSFIFTINEDGEEWVKGEDGVLRRSIKTIKNLYDTSTVIDGAYSNTVVSVARNLSDLIEPPKLEVETTTVIEEVKPNVVNDMDLLNLNIILLENE